MGPRILHFNTLTDDAVIWASYLQWVYSLMVNVPKGSYVEGLLCSTWHYWEARKYLEGGAFRKEVMWLWKSPTGDTGTLNPSYTMRWQGHISHRLPIWWTELTEASNLRESSDYGMGLLNTSIPINYFSVLFSFVVLGERIQGCLYARWCSSPELLPILNLSAM